MNKSIHGEIRDLTLIPGVGSKIAGDLIMLGVRSVSDLRGRDPQQLYRSLCDLTGTHVDRCMLYVFRCAVYWASTKHHDPELLKWWNWKEDHAYRADA